MISSIAKHADFERYEYKSSDEDIIDNLSRINILIGKNNSGKSSFIRALFKKHVLNYKVKAIDLDGLNQIIFNFKNEIQGFNDRHSLENYGSVITILNSINFIANYSSTFNFKEEVYDRVSRITNIGSDHSHVITRSGLSHDEVVRHFGSIGGKYLSQLDVYNEQFNSIKKYKKLYIPIVRGLRPIYFELESQKFSYRDSYHERTLKDYFPSLQNDSVIFTGLGIYGDTQRYLLGNTEQRIKIRSFELFLSETFFDGQEINIVPRLDDDVVHIKIGRTELPIYDLGDGIQAIIALMFPLFFYQNEDYLIFIEEPEMHLHPGLQRIFIESLMKKEFNSFQFFITTHSNHFLDMVLDVENISVYSLSKNEKFEISNVTNPDNSVLDQIGVRNSSVFLSNCTIWVEGITDRIYIRRYLEIYQKTQNRQFKEDFHYSFIEYGGNNITHFSFLDDEDSQHPNINVDRVCSKLILITDRDSDKPKKGGELTKKQERREKLKQKLGNRYICLEASEMENILSEKVIEGTIREYEPSNHSLDFTKLKYEKYKDKKIGDFISKNVPGITRKYRSDSGTISDKVSFCKIAVGHIYELDDLTPEALSLITTIYDFIKVQNLK